MRTKNLTMNVSIGHDEDIEINDVLIKVNMDIEYKAHEYDWDKWHLLKAEIYQYLYNNRLWTAVYIPDQQKGMYLCAGLFVDEDAYGQVFNKDGILIHNKKSAEEFLERNSGQFGNGCGDEFRFNTIKTITREVRQLETINKLSKNI